MRLLLAIAVSVLISACSSFQNSETSSERTPASVTTRAVRGSILHFTADPFVVGDNKSYQYFPDGILVIENGIVKSVGNYGSVQIPAGPQLDDYRGQLIVPGFIDTHIHMPQTEMIGSYGEQLLDWLNKYTFPTEKQFKDKAYSAQVAKFFINQLLSNGTTTALVFGTVHKESVDAFFEESDRLNLRMIAGKVMMDNPSTTPDFLRDTAKSSYDDSKDLIQRWHNHGRQLYAVTPRFAITSTKDQLKAAGELLKEFPTVYMHTHVSENKDEIAFTKSLFPEANGYLDVYDRYGLLGKNSVFAHGVHLTESELQRLHDTDSAISHCPTSNLFLGSGLFNLESAKNSKRPVKVGMGTDVGAGTSFSMLMTMNEAYKIQQLQKVKLSAFKAFYLSTLGSAKALNLDNKIGNFQTGKEADFVVLNLSATKLQSLRIKKATDLHDKLFATMTLGDDRNVIATYSGGKLVYKSVKNP